VPAALELGRCVALHGVPFPAQMAGVGSAALTTPAADPMA